MLRNDLNIRRIRSFFKALSRIRFARLPLLILLLNVAFHNVQSQTNDQDTSQIKELTIPMEGETGVTSEIDNAYIEEESIFGTPMENYLNWKDRVRDKTGFSYSLMGLWLYQYATTSLTDNNNGLGQWYRLPMSWVLVGRKTGHSGRIEARLEYRSNIGALPAPTTLGNEVGIVALNPGFGYIQNFPLDIAVMNWTQMFLNNKLGIAIGRLSFDGYMDVSPFQSLTRGITNRSFGLNPTLATTGIGALGFVIKGDLPGGFWLGLHMYDANAVNGEFNRDVFKLNEWLTVFEAGWTHSDEQFNTDRIIFTYWIKDERKEAGVSSGSGWAVSASHQVAANLLPFIRFGHSNGGGGVAALTALSGGIEWGFRPDQAWTLGVGWAKPNSGTSELDLRDEYVAETSYKVQIIQALQVLLDAQLIIDPANATDSSYVGIFGFRTIVQL